MKEVAKEKHPSVHSEVARGCWGGGAEPCYFLLPPHRPDSSSQGFPGNLKRTGCYGIVVVLHLARCWFFWFSAENLEGGEREPSSANYLCKQEKSSRGSSSQRGQREIFRRLNPIGEAPCVCVCVGSVSTWHEAEKRGKSAQVTHRSNAAADIWAPFFRAGAVWSP